MLGKSTNQMLWQIETHSYEYYQGAVKKHSYQ